jgi:cyclophilin family peptidyl-prolyl cis-trans isomerase
LKQFFVFCILLILTLFTFAGCGSSSAASPLADCSKAHFLPESGKPGAQWSSPPAMKISKKCSYTAYINTSKGLIVAKLDPKSVPIAVNNFVFLATNKFYTNILFHRVIKGFMIQTGDPQGTGTGGPGYSFKIESGSTNFVPGTLAYANTSAPNSNGSQFFICAGSQCSSLGSAPAPGYTVFGNVTKGEAVVNAIAAVPVQQSAQGTDVSSPVHPVYMKSVRIYIAP